jgi:hypothetical protein
VEFELPLTTGPVDLGPLSVDAPCLVSTVKRRPDPPCPCETTLTYCGFCREMSDVPFSAEIVCLEFDEVTFPNCADA